MLLVLLFSKLSLGRVPSSRVNLYDNMYISKKENELHNILLRKHVLMYVRYVTGRLGEAQQLFSSNRLLRVTGKCGCIVDVSISFI